LKQPIDSWDALVIHIISLKFDSVTRKEWETEYSKPNMSDLKVFTAFLQEKSRLLETLSMNNPSNLPIVLYVHFETKNIREKGWCLNCLRTNHRTEQCRSSPCRKCSKKHNTLLHNNTFSQEQTSNNASFSYPQAAINDNQSSRAQSVSNDNKLNSDFTYSFHCYYGTSRVLLSTAIVDVLDSDGNMHSCRVMLDSGSESSFITEQMFNKLNLCTTSTNISVSGICLVTSKVALDTSGLKIPPNVILADPSIDQPNSIDILIGIDKFWDLLSTGQIKLGKNLTVIQKTHLGWVISGPITTHCNSFKVSCNPNTSETLDVTLTKFWELEEKFLSRPLSIEDQRCEESFLKTTTQRPDGHFVVQLPFRHSESYLGHSKKIAIKRFLNLERKLNRNPLLKSDYSKFLEEYEALANDTFKYSINVQLSQRFTKRTILSNFGNAEWKDGWDESVPLDILTSYREFYSQLGDLNDLKVSRKIMVSRHVLVELHGFADASEIGYGACIYLRSVNGEGHCSVSLLCSKTRY
ncbi:hypothetical protein YQE_09501, partial [Dendroctonus ponderosae]